MRRRGAGVLALQRAGEGQRDLCVVVVQFADLWDVGIGEEDFASPAGKLLDCGMDPHMICLCKVSGVIACECAAHVRRVQEHKVPRRGVLQDLLEVAAGCTDVVGCKVFRGSVDSVWKVEARVYLAPVRAVEYPYFAFGVLGVDAVERKVHQVYKIRCQFGVRRALVVFLFDSVKVGLSALAPVCCHRRSVFRGHGSQHVLESLRVREHAVERCHRRGDVVEMDPLAAEAQGEKQRRTAGEGLVVGIEFPRQQGDQLREEALLCAHPLEQSHDYTGRAGKPTGPGLRVLGLKPNEDIGAKLRDPHHR